MLHQVGELLDVHEALPGQGVNWRDEACAALVANRPSVVVELLRQLPSAQVGCWAGLVNRCIILELLLLARRQRCACEAAPKLSPTQAQRPALQARPQLGRASKSAKDTQAAGEARARDSLEHELISRLVRPGIP